MAITKKRFTIYGCRFFLNRQLWRGPREAPSRCGFNSLEVGTCRIWRPISSFHRSRSPDELWTQRYGRLPSAWHLHGPNSQGRESCRPARPVVHQSRADHQSAAFSGMHVIYPGNIGTFLHDTPSRSPAYPYGIRRTRIALWTNLRSAPKIAIPASDQAEVFLRLGIRFRKVWTNAAFVGSKSFSPLVHCDVP